MKVVINCCFGGFGLSLEAQNLYAEKSGFELFHYKQVKYDFQGDGSLYKKVVGLPAEGGMFVHSYTQDLGDEFSGDANDDSYWSYYDLKRDDPVLIEVVEELGAERASGSCASLRVVEIPDNIEWAISEYDGNEHIEEAHQTWR